MTTFSAVTTTGIYCRPGCSARPRPDHVRQFEVAAAAEAAGFRACLRCRPYRVSQPIGDIGPELVCRAVQLVVDGALDDGTEAELASRLGVSARHLRRLFVEHVGATPDQVARSRRAHFARRLLDDTDLTITEIAFAAGFGSVRQMNRVCLELFRATPGNLRARRRSHDRLVADGGLSLRLTYQPPLDWDHLVRYFAARAIPGVEHSKGGVYRRTVLIDGDPGVLEFGRGDDDHLVLRAHLPHWEGLIHVVQRARRLFDLDAPIATINAHLSRDRGLRPLVRRQPGVRLPGAWDPFELGVRAILGQQVTVAGATRLAGRLVEQLGMPVPGLGPFGLSHTFPTADRVADADLTRVGVPGRRAAAIAAFAAAVADGKVVLDRSVTRAGLVDALAALPGIGPWTANYIAMRTGHPDAFPAGDLGVQKAMAQFGLDGHADHWSPWRAYATQHLWAALAPNPPSGGP